MARQARTFRARFILEPTSQRNTSRTDRHANLVRVIQDSEEENTSNDRAGSAGQRENRADRSRVVDVAVLRIHCGGGAVTGSVPIERPERGSSNENDRASNPNDERGG